MGPSETKMSLILKQEHRIIADHEVPERKNISPSCTGKIAHATF
jgi:hypothetical protein